jgi:hypothetical protein
VAHQDGQDCGTGICFCSRLSEQGRNPLHQTDVCPTRDAQNGDRPLTSFKKEGPENGPCLGSASLFFQYTGVRKTAPSFSKKPVLFWISCQEIGLWRWSNFLHSQIKSGKEALHVNLDETGIRMHQVSGQGLLVTAARQQKRKAESLAQYASTKMLRGNFTHVALICDNDEAQKLLPQILIVNKHMVTEQQHHALVSGLPPNVILLRRHTAWMTSELMTRVLAVIKQSLAPFLDTHQIFLTADAYRAHVTTDVWKHCVKNSILYCLVPSKLTWALQPCDTHVFALYKHRLQTICQNVAVDSATGKLSLEAIVKGVCQCIAEILEGRSWASAFTDTGLTGSQAQVSQRVQAKLSFAAIPDAGSELPTLAQLQYVFPRNAVLPIDNIFGMFLSRSSAVGSVRIPYVDTTVHPADPEVWPAGPVTRSRSASRAILEAALAQEPCPTTRPLHHRPRLQLRQLPRLVRLPQQPGAILPPTLPPSSPMSQGQSAASSSATRSSG